MSSASAPWNEKRHLGGEAAAVKGEQKSRKKQNGTSPGAGSGVTFSSAASGLVEGSRIHRALHAQCWRSSLALSSLLSSEPWSSLGARPSAHLLSLRSPAWLSCFPGSSQGGSTGTATLRLLGHGVWKLLPVTLARVLLTTRLCRSPSCVKGTMLSEGLCGVGSLRTPPEVSKALHSPRAGGSQSD